MLTTSELADIRNDYNTTFLTDTAQVLSHSTASGPNGPVEVWSLTATYPCRYSEASNPAESVVVDETVAKQFFNVFMPFGAAVTAENRLQVGNLLLEVNGVATVRTEAICSRVMCTALT
jgi:hypothetical protein